MEEEGRILAHASVVPRQLTAAGRALRFGYLEAVATRPGHRKRGLASVLMTEVGAHIRSSYELGALDAGVPGFYERFGGRVWEGPTSVQMPSGETMRTVEEDGDVMELLPPDLDRIDPSGPLTCDRRAGDAW